MTMLDTPKARLEFIRNYCKECDRKDEEILKVAHNDSLNSLYTESKLDEETEKELLAGATLKTL